MWLICIVAEMTAVTSASTLIALERIFCQEGFPETVVSDNGTQLTSEEFRKFCRNHGIVQITTAPFHPSSNGEAERFVRTFKTALKKFMDSGEGLDKALQKVLFTYRTTPNGEEGKSPAELLHGRQPRTKLALLDESKESPRQDAKQGSYKFQVNEYVWARYFNKGPKWWPGKIVKRQGSCMYLVETKKGILRRHQNQL